VIAGDKCDGSTIRKLISPIVMSGVRPNDPATSNLHETAYIATLTPSESVAPPAKLAHLEIRLD
jgi:hypothetical protein